MVVYLIKHIIKSVIRVLYNNISQNSIKAPKTHQAFPFYIKKKGRAFTYVLELS